jgi:hypothetical protein
LPVQELDFQALPLSQLSAQATQRVPSLGLLVADWVESLAMRIAARFAAAEILLAENLASASLDEMLL